MTEPSMEAIDQTILDGIPQPNRTMAPFRYYGGKGQMAKKIVPLIPKTKIYVEPYCGAASIFWHLASREVEVLNDLNGEIINLFRVLQDPKQFSMLKHRLVWTPYSLDEFRRALIVDASDPVEWAWATFVKYGQGFGGIVSKTQGQWGRAFISHRGMAATSCRWRGRLKLLDWWHNRLSRVQLDNRDAIEVIEYWDSEETMCYCDPPYLHATRVATDRNTYEHEMTIEQHKQMLNTLLEYKGYCIVSGYDDPLYQILTDNNWNMYRFDTSCYAAVRGRGTKLRGTGAGLEQVPRTECVWTNPKVNNKVQPLFAK